MTMTLFEESLPSQEAVRCLASVQYIRSIQVHRSSPALSTAKVLGWEVVVCTGHFSEGDSVVFLEVDAVIPKEAPFMDHVIGSARGTRRVETELIRGELSQGVCLPLSVLPSLGTRPWILGTDVTALLNITKYNPQDIMFSKKGQVGNFPVDLIPKTDEPRAQSFPEIVTRLRGLPWIATVKYDGMSGTFFTDPNTGEFTVCSRNQKRPFPPSLNWNELIQGPRTPEILTKVRGLEEYWQVAIANDLPTKLARYPHLVLQAEIIGPKIQANRLNVTHNQLHIFNVFDMKKRRYLDHDDAVEFCHRIGLPTCELAAEGLSFDLDIPKLLRLSQGFYRGTSNHREGIVIKARKEGPLQTVGKRLSFKVINNDYLLKFNEK